MTLDEIINGRKVESRNGIPDMRQLIPISRYHKKLMQDIDEADWLGDSETADRLRYEVEHVQAEINRGATYIPTF